MNQNRMWLNERSKQLYRDISKIVYGRDHSEDDDRILEMSATYAGHGKLSSIFIEFHGTPTKYAALFAPDSHSIPNFRGFRLTGFASAASRLPKSKRYQVFYLMARFLYQAGMFGDYGKEAFNERLRHEARTNNVELARANLAWLWGLEEALQKPPPWNLRTLSIRVRAIRSSKCRSSVD
jgi:hypothetical protein